MGKYVEQFLFFLFFYVSFHPLFCIWSFGTYFLILFIYNYKILRTKGYGQLPATGQNRPIRIEHTIFTMLHYIVACKMRKSKIEWKDEKKRKTFDEETEIKEEIVTLNYFDLSGINFNLLEMMNRIMFCVCPFYFLFYSISFGRFI